MKKITALSFAFAVSLAAFAMSPDSVKTKKKPAAAKDRILVGGGFANWLNAPADTKIKFFGSRAFDAAVMYDQPLGSGPISVALGLGFSGINMSTNLQFLQDSLGNTVLTPYPDSVFSDIKRNKLSTNYVNIPFELRYRSKPDKAYRRWNVAAGFKFGLLVQSHFKYETKAIKLKTYSIDNLNLLNYGPTLRFGYGQISVYGYYSLSGLFEKGKGPEITPFNFGLVLAPF